jgi:hypothetical protein
MTSVSQWLLNSDGITGYRIPYQPILWWFFPFFGALSLCFEITLQTWALFAGHKIVNLYSEWDGHQPKSHRGRMVYCDGRSWLRKGTLFLALPIGVFTALALNMHTTFGSDGVHEFGCGFAKPIFHPYSEIRRVSIIRGYRTGRSNKWQEKPSFVLDFIDGQRWEQSEFDDDRLPQNFEALSNLLRNNTKLEFGLVNSDKELNRP